MRRTALRAWVLCWLMLVWILLWGTVSAANLISGLAVALVITLLLPLPVVPIEGRVHPLSLLRLIGLVAYYLVLSSVQVAWLAVKPGPPPLTAVLRAQLAVKSDLVLALAVNIVNLIPGSDRAGDRPGATDALRARHRRRFGAGRGPVLPPDRADRAAAGGVVRARRPLAALGPGERMTTRRRPRVRIAARRARTGASGVEARRVDHRRGHADGPRPSSPCSGCWPGRARWTGWSRWTPSSR